jgi:hypothetical protein
MRTRHILVKGRRLYSPRKKNRFFFVRGGEFRYRRNSSGWHQNMLGGVLECVCIDLSGNCALNKQFRGGEKCGKSAKIAFFKFLP